MRLSEIMPDRDSTFLGLKLIELVKMYDQLEIASDHFTIPPYEILGNHSIAEFVERLSELQLSMKDKTAQRYITQMLDWLK